MQNLPNPLLGDVWAITIATPDLDLSFEFYQKLGFSELWRSDFPFPCMQITDGALLMMLRKDNNPYIALTYYVKDHETVAKKVEEQGISFAMKPQKTDPVQRYLFNSPDGLNISLVGFMEGFVQPPGATLLTMPQQDFFNPEKYSNKTCGMFGEFCHPVADLDRSIEFWGKIGFKVLSQFKTTYPWAILSDGMSIIGLHQTKEFSYPAITYFAADMKEKIENLKGSGMKVHKEKGPSNIELLSPEQQHIFLFKLGM